MNVQTPFSPPEASVFTSFKAPPVSLWPPCHPFTFSPSAFLDWVSHSSPELALNSLRTTVLICLELKLILLPQWLQVFRVLRFQCVPSHPAPRFQPSWAMRFPREEPGCYVSFHLQNRGHICSMCTRCTLADPSVHTSCFLFHSENSTNAVDKVSGWLEGSGLHLIIWGCVCGGTF